MEQPYKSTCIAELLCANSHAYLHAVICVYYIGVIPSQSAICSLMINKK